MKKKASLIVAVLALSIVCGCGKEKEAGSAAAQSKDYVYSFENYKEKLADRELSQSIVTDNGIVFINYRYEEADVPMPEARTYEEAVAEVTVAEVAVEEAAVEDVLEVDGMAADMPVDEFYDEYEYVEPTTYLQVLHCDFEGNLLTEFEKELPQGSSVYCMNAGRDGKIYFVLCEYGKDTTNPDYYKDIYSLVGYSQSGEELFSVVLNEDIPAEEYYYANEVVCDNDGNLILWSSKGVQIYDANGTFLRNVDVSVEEASSLYVMRDNRVLLQYYGDSNMFFKELNVETGELSERIDVPYNAYNYSHYVGKTVDFLLVDAMGVHTFNLGDAEVKKIMDFVDSDLTTNSCYSIGQISDESFFAWSYDEIEGMDQCGIYTKVDPASIPDKKILTLGAIWLDTDVRTRVVEFNKESTEYRICVEDYNKYNTIDDYSLATTKLNTDIATGNAPDILCLTGEMPVDSYMSKGLFADINEFLEKDPELNKEDYMQEVIDAYSWDGKWYQLVPSYYLFTVFGKAADVGTQPGWTVEDLQALHSKKGEDVQIFSEFTKSSVMSYSMMLGSKEYINWETGECYFNTPEFISLLEFVNEFPDEIDYQEIYNDPNYWESQETAFRDGRVLLQPYTLANFQDFVYCEQGVFGEPITAIGFPVREGVGSAFSGNQNFAINAKSEYPEVAWEFLRYYLTDEYQDNISYGWPIKTSSMDKLVEAAQKRPSYEDENGNVIEYDDTYYINGIEVVLEPLTQEDCDRVLQFIKSAEHEYSYDSNIMTILEEECAAFYAGQKTAKEVADIIQSRVHIYVNENL